MLEIAHAQEVVAPPFLQPVSGSSSCDNEIGSRSSLEVARLSLRIVYSPELVFLLLRLLLLESEPFRA